MKTIISELLRKTIFSIILLLISPLLIVIAIVIIFDDGFPVLFRQKRIGVNNCKFWIYKFRTMKNNTPNVATHLLRKEMNPYTLSGPLLRKLSLDELPQIINIIKGDIALIGPRPALYNQYRLIELRKNNGVHLLKPGLTGWAQVNGRDELTLQKKVALDVFYKDNKSIIMDIKIFFLTIIKVIKADGVSR